MDLAALKLPVRIESERVYLRFLRYSDSGWYYEMALRNKAHLLKYEPGNAVFCIHNTEEAEAMMGHFEDICEKRKEFYLGVFRRDTDRFVGQVFIGLSNTEIHACSLGFFAEVSHEGKGYMTEAVQAVLHFMFNILHADRVDLECDASNSRSVRLAERCGFEKKDVSSKHPSSLGSLHFALDRDQGRRLGVPPPRYQYL
ncbi:MAG: GNAT family N-acetyltransferase [Opitutaceae bacterium]|jgi:RimJ/RimL family protein N-acetyltransferase